MNPALASNVDKLSLFDKLNKPNIIYGLIWSEESIATNQNLVFPRSIIFLEFHTKVSYHRNLNEHVVEIAKMNCL